MAFFCPVRIRRNKKKHGRDFESNLLSGTQQALPMGRITGSASIETLVRVGIEKENGLASNAKMIVLHDFTPCVDDELEVKSGQIVNVLYQENDWVYVISEYNPQREGFIPASYCAPLKTQIDNMVGFKKKIPRSEPNSLVNYNFNDQHVSTNHQNITQLVDKNFLNNYCNNMIVSNPGVLDFQLNQSNTVENNFNVQEFQTSASNYQVNYSPSSHSFPIESVSQQNNIMSLDIVSNHNTATPRSIGAAPSMISAGSNGMKSTNVSSSQGNNVQMKSMSTPPSLSLVNVHTLSRSYGALSPRNDNYSVTFASNKNYQLHHNSRHHPTNNGYNHKHYILGSNVDSIYLSNQQNQLLKKESNNQMIGEQLMGEVQPFFKDQSGRYVMLYTFIARDENDISVERGEIVTVLNKDDSDWYWVMRADAQEGFVPVAFTYPVDLVLNM